MTKVYLDSLPPDANCPFALGQPEEQPSIDFFLRQHLRKYVYMLLSGRPKKVRPPIPDNPRCVAVATGGNLGGAIISIPLIRGIREKWPDAQLVVISNRQHSVEIIQRAGIGDIFIVAPEVPLAKVLLGDISVRHFRRQVCALSPDIFISNFNFGPNQVMPLRHIPCLIGQGLVSLNNPDRFLFDYFINYDSSCQNWLEGYWKILEFFSVRQYNYPTIATNPRMGASFLHNLIGAATQQDPIYVGVQASVWHMHAWKAWPTQKMTELCLRLISDERIYVVIFGQPGQDELCKSIKAQCSQNVRVINAVGKLSIAQLPDAVAACSVVVSNDSGLMHLAAAVGTPTVAIYGMTDQEVSWVYGDATHSTLVRRAKTNPCYHKVRNITKYCVSKECINNISVDLVFTATTEILYGK